MGENKQLTQSGIRRPRLSINRPTRTVKKTNVNKRLSLSSISKHMVTSDDISNKKDDYFETMSNKSTESRYSVNSKISLVSSASNRSIFTNSTNGYHTPITCKEDEIKQEKMKEMKLKNAELDLQIEKMKIEKEFYANIIQSIKSIASSYDEDINAMEVDDGDNSLNIVIKQILEI